MAKHPTSSRAQRGDQPPDDVFVSTVKRTLTWARENPRQVMVGGAAVIVLALVGAWYITQQRSLEAAATTRYTQVQESVVSGNAQLAIRDLREFLDTYGSTRVAQQARLTLADILIREEQPRQAIEALGDLPDRLDEPLGLAAARVEASALEILERYDEAIAAYRRIADEARFPFQRRQALDDAARVELHNGQPEQAVAILEELVATFDEDEAARGYYEMMLAEARARAQAGSGAATPSAADTAG
ncbi:MAG: tetratricopeptide repeat protein [Gemmatimonadota bacterium]